MKTKVLILTAALTLSMVAFAQSSPSSSTPSTQDAGPATVDQEALLEVILGRIHRVYGGVQVLKDTMKENGATTFRDIYMIEGSALHDGEFFYNPNREDSHSIGYHVLPYELTVTRDGHFSGRIAIAGGKHLNNTKGASGARKVINDFRVFDFIWDTDSDNINTYSVTIASMDVRLGLFKKNGSWVSLNLGGSLGFDYRQVPKEVSGQSESVKTDNYTGRVGIEFNIALGKAFSFHGLTMYQIAYLTADTEGDNKKCDNCFNINGFRSHLTNQVEVNYHFNSGHRGYKSSAGIYLQSKHKQRNIMHRGPDELDFTQGDRDFSGDTYTGGFQIKW